MPCECNRLSARLRRILPEFVYESRRGQMGRE
jgi:hypothetical protein